MKLVHILYLTGELSPFTGESDHAKESRFLCRGLAELGLAVTVIAPARGEVASRGLARRLSPLAVGSSRVTVYEGALPGGRVEVFAIDSTSTAPSDVPSDLDDGSAFAAAAVELVAHRQHPPDVVVGAHGAERAFVAVAAALSGPGGAASPALVFNLRQFEESPELTDALAASDRVVVPSPSFAASLRRDPEAHGLPGSIVDRVRGVASGIDTLDWNPRRDPYLPDAFATFSADPQGHKALCKEEVQRRHGLKVQADIPLIAAIGPLDPVILTYPASNEITQRELQLIVLGDRQRDAKCLRGFARLANQSSSKVALCTPSDPGEARALEHVLLAAADFVLFARRFSPGALCELYCLRYGAVPIAPRDGSFADVLVEFDSNTQTGSGFLFTPNQGEHVVAAVDRALRVYRQTECHAALVERALAIDLSWSTAAQRYTNLFAEILREKGLLAA